MFMRPLGWDGPTPGSSAVRSLPAIVTVYLISSKDGPIKIGYANRFARRIKDPRLADAYLIEVRTTVEEAPFLDR
jgi:hypothetical protein